MTTQIFVNLPVKELEKSMKFFKALGFTFNPQFTDDNGACLVIGENIYAMLLTEPFFKTFIPKETYITDAKNEAETLIAIDVENREAVDEMVEKAVEAGGKTYRDPQTEGDWMYNCAFMDPDGHRWEVVYMDITKAPASPSAS